MKKKVLYISRAYINDSPVGIRYINFRKYLEATTELTVLNLTGQSLLFSQRTKFNRFINRIIRKLPLLPDSDILILRKYKKALKKLLHQNKYDTVIIGILPVSFLYLAEFVKKINPELKTIVDMSDPISAQISFRSLLKLKQNFLLKLEEKCFKFIDSLIVLNDEIKEYYKKKYNIRNIIIIEQGIEKSLIMNDKKVKYNNLDEIKLIYAGQLYKGGREPFELYEAITKTRYKVKLNIYGNFKKYFRPPKNDRFYYGGIISRKELINKYKESQIIVFIDNKDTLQIPGKTIEILTFNKPILFIYYNYDSPTFNYVKKYEGIYFSNNNSDDINSSINDIMINNNFYFKRDLTNYIWNNLLTRISNII